MNEFVQFRIDEKDCGQKPFQTICVRDGIIIFDSCHGCKNFNVEKRICEIIRFWGEPAFMGFAKDGFLFLVKEKEME